MPFQINPHLKARQTDPVHLRQRLEEEAVELERQIAAVKEQLAALEGGDTKATGGSNGIKGRLVAMNTTLSTSSFLSGPEQWGKQDKDAFDSLKGDKGFREIQKGGFADMPHLKRWWDYGSLLVRQEAKAAKGDAGNDGKKGGKKTEKEEADKMVLEHAEQGKVVTRFPPEASGFMHIGHAKAALANHLISQKYGGRMVFRFDDTNPSKEKHEFEEAIVKDTKSLGVPIDKITYTSDRFDEMMKLCDKMLQEGTAYCDDTPVDQMREERMARKPSKCRNQSVKQNIAMWTKMKDGTAAGTVVRAKIDMNEDNACMRDPVLYRVNADTPHVKTGTKYKCYPTYDFACPVVDSLDGVTHALRTSEYNDRNAQYFWVCDALKIRKPHIQDFSRMNMEFTVLSKRKLTQFVETGLVESWDDPRMPTVQGLLRRGLTVPALAQFISHQGMSKVNNFQEWGWMWNANNKNVDMSARRYVAVARDYGVKIKVDGCDGKTTKTRPRHSKNPDLGEKTYYQSNSIILEDVDCDLLAAGEEVTLMSWGNAFFSDYNKAKQTAKAKLNPGGDVKKTKYKLTWLADVPENKVLCELVEFDHLITAKKPPKKVSPAQESGAGEGGPEDDDDDDDTPGGIEAVINPKTKWQMWAWGEEALGKEVKKGDIIQLERRGFFICDKTEPHLVLFSIPDGHDKLPVLSMRAREVREKGGGEGNQPAAKEKKKKQTDQREMTLEEKRAAKKAQKNKETEASKAGDAKAAGKEGLNGASLDIRIGRILEIKPHPDADALFVETIDIGEEKPRTIISGLRKFYSEADLNGKSVAVLCNLKPANMRGVESCGMVLCASTEDKSKVKVLDVPAAAKPGDRVTFPGLSGEPVAELPKKKVPDLLKPLHTDAKGVAHWDAAPFTLASGSVSSELKDAVVS